MFLRLFLNSRFRLSGVFRIVATVVVLCSALPSDAAVEDRTSRFLPVSRSVDDDIDYLFALAADKNGSFDPRKVRDLLDFVASRRARKGPWDPRDRDGAQGAFYETEIHASLDRIVAYAFNPGAVPCSFVRPSSIRMCGWYQEAKAQSAFRKLQSPPPDPYGFVMVRGVQYLENTPEPSTGGYYRYDADQLLIRMQQDGRPLLIVVTRQKKRSDSGKKGMVLDDRNWDYFYSGEKGLTLRGAGWATTYVYDSRSISVYYQVTADPPRTLDGEFCWVKGGWCSINMVCRDPIYEGLKRSAAGFKKVLESPRLPDVRTIAREYKRIRSLSREELKRQLGSYVQHLMVLARDHPLLSRPPFLTLLQTHRYLDTFTRRELEDHAMLEYLKRTLGKTQPSRAENAPFQAIPHSTHLNPTAASQADEAGRSSPPP